MRSRPATIPAICLNGSLIDRQKVKSPLRRVEGLSWISQDEETLSRSGHQKRHCGDQDVLFGHRFVKCGSYTLIPPTLRTISAWRASTEWICKATVRLSSLAIRFPACTLEAATPRSPKVLRQHAEHVEIGEHIQIGPASYEIRLRSRHSHVTKRGLQQCNMLIDTTVIVTDREQDRTGFVGVGRRAGIQRLDTLNQAILHQKAESAIDRCRCDARMKGAQSFGVDAAYSESGGRADRIASILSRYCWP